MRHLLVLTKKRKNMVIPSWAKASSSITHLASSREPHSSTDPRLLSLSKPANPVRLKLTNSLLSTLTMSLTLVRSLRIKVGAMRLTQIAQKKRNKILFCSYSPTVILVLTCNEVWKSCLGATGTILMSASLTRATVLSMIRREPKAEARDNKCWMIRVKT